MQYLRSGKCRKRKIQTLVLILVIVVLYFILQFFSLSKLGLAQGTIKKLHFQDVVGVNDVVDFEMGDDSAGLKFNQQPVVISVPRGVHPSDAARYAEDSSGIFTCLDSEVLILDTLYY